VYRFQALKLPYPGPTAQGTTMAKEEYETPHKQERWAGKASCP
jgi:hypothetical protein